MSGNVKLFEDARAKLVSARLQKAREIVAVSGVVGNGLIVGIIDIQEAIQAIDAAIKDESKSKRGSK